jgi:hypothetical protein
MLSDDLHFSIYGLGLTERQAAKFKVFIFIILNASNNLCVKVLADFIAYSRIPSSFSVLSFASVLGTTRHAVNSAF